MAKSKHILIVDDMAIVRDPIAICLRNAGFTAACATNGREALISIKNTPPDLILLDVAMPEMDGLTLLRNLQAQNPNHKIPVLLLTAISDKKLILDAAKLGVRGYMLKSRFSLEDLITRIRQNFKDSSQETKSDSSAALVAPPQNQNLPAESAPAPSTKPSPQQPDPNEAIAKSLGVTILLTREKCLERAEKALHGKALSGVVAQVIQLTTTPSSNTAQLGESISHDPMLAAKVLRIANSTAYASARGPVTSVSDAIKKIGFSTVRNIASTVGIIEAMPTTQANDNFNPIRSWQHSFAVAMLTERLVSITPKANPSDTAVGFLAGLCHDLGEILFQTCFGEEYQKVREAHERTKHPMATLEKVMLGMPTSELIGLTLRSLSLPDAIRAPIEAMHGPTPTKDHLGAILCLADIYANGMLLAASPKSPLRSFTSAEYQNALTTSAIPELDRTKIRSEIFALTMLLSQISDPKLTAPLFPPSKSTVWLAREKGFSKLDPVEVALESIAKVQSRNRLPTPEEVSSIKAVIIESEDAAMSAFNSQNIAALKASAKKKLPILWLAHKCEISIAPASQDATQPTLMPAPLDTLANFVAAAA